MYIYIYRAALMHVSGREYRGVQTRSGREYNAIMALFFVKHRQLWPILIIYAAQFSLHTRFASAVAARGRLL